MHDSDVITVGVLLPEAEEVLGLSDGLILHAIIKLVHVLNKFYGKIIAAYTFLND